MVEIGGRPILWHIMKHNAHYGLRDFVVALGYKGEYIKRYFVEYTHFNHTNLTVNFRDGWRGTSSAASRLVSMTPSYPPAPTGRAPASAKSCTCQAKPQAPHSTHE